MRLYLEIEGPVAEGMREEAEKEFVRIKADLGTSDEKLKAWAARIAAELGWAEWVAYKHVCRHDEGKACERILVGKGGG